MNKTTCFKITCTFLFIFLEIYKYLYSYLHLKCFKISVQNAGIANALCILPVTFDSLFPKEAALFPNRLGGVLGKNITEKNNLSLAPLCCTPSTNRMTWCEYQEYKRWHSQVVLMFVWRTNLTLNLLARPCFTHIIWRTSICEPCLSLREDCCPPAHVRQHSDLTFILNLI